MPDPIIPEVIEPDEALPADLRALRKFAWLLDEAFAIPGTRRRIGLDATIGLIPGVGDTIGAAMSSWIIFGAIRHRVPFRVVVRMVFAVIVDLTVGAIPVVGDVFDFLFRENVGNVNLLLRHRDRGRPPRSATAILLGVSAVVVVLLIAAIVAMALFIAAINAMIGR